MADDEAQSAWDDAEATAADPPREGGDEQLDVETLALLAPSFSVKGYPRPISPVEMSGALALIAEQRGKPPKRVRRSEVDAALSEFLTREAPNGG